MALAGVSSRVANRQRSYIAQRQGHSRPVRKMADARDVAPLRWLVFDRQILNRCDRAAAGDLGDR
jgi:hypothetical protein